jgi:alpha-1,2-mannosyltransferase
MYANTLAFSSAVAPVSSPDRHRTFAATLAFAAGAIFGWPFAIVVSFPYVFEEVFMRGIDHVTANVYPSWIVQRVTRLAQAVAVSALLVVPVVALDSLFYGRLTVTPWNIIQYNVFPDAKRGPNLYGTEPWSFYFLNLGLNFNVLLPLALASLPALCVTYVFDRKRLGGIGAPDQSNTYNIMALRLAPVYLWIGLLSLQAHKEERFMYPIYTLMCFNAASTLYLIRGWIEVVFIKVTKSPYQVWIVLFPTSLC